MSYDLYFKSRAGKSSPSAEDFAAYFRARPNYEVSKQQAIYENEATGVYFIFDIGSVENEEEPGLLPLSFNLNYLRPHIFGLEAELELSELVKQFDLLVSDAQIDGMSEGEYSAEGFLRGWNTGNEFGYRSILSQNPGHQPMNLPTAQIESCWRWNFAKDALQSQFGEEVFVPRFLFMKRGNGVVSAVAWPDGIPIAMPEAQLVLIQRRDILPRKLFIRREDIVMADWSEVVTLLQQFPAEQGALEYRLLRFPQPPEAVVTHLKALIPTKEQPEAVSVDKILNRELVEKIRSK